MTTEKIIIQIGNEIKELEGAEKETYLAQRQADKVQFDLLEAEYEAKKQLKIDAITKLSAASGLTEDEINAIIGVQ
jgi:hypothetical protein